MKTALALQHVAFEDLGNLAPLLARRGYKIEYRDAVLDALDTVDPRAADLLVVLGGPIGVYEDATYPFIRAELGLLEARIEADKPTLGICLGAQLIARALGARVYPGQAKEIGWAPVSLSTAGATSALKHLDGVSVLHWHGDTFDLPPSAVHLASTPAYPNQAFAQGRRALALQFHPEAVAVTLERWYVGHACEIAATPKVSVAALRAEAEKLAPALGLAAEKMWTAWLDAVGA